MTPIAVTLFIASIVVMVFCLSLRRGIRLERERLEIEKERYRKALEMLRERYQRDVDAIKEQADIEISARQGRISTLKCELATLEQSVSSWKGEAENRHNEAQQLEQECSKLQHTVSNLADERFKLGEEAHRLQATITRCEQTLESLKSAYDKLLQDKEYLASVQERLSKRRASEQERFSNRRLELLSLNSEIESSVSSLIAILKTIPNNCEDGISEVYRIHNLLNRLRKTLQAIENAPNEARSEMPSGEESAADRLGNGPWSDWRDRLDAMK